MGDMFEFLIGAVILFFTFTFLLRGLVKAFRRNWIVALLLLLFFVPALLVWAIIETILMFQQRNQQQDPAAIGATPPPVEGAIKPGMEESIREEQEQPRPTMADPAPSRMEPPQPRPAQYLCMNCEAPIRLTDSKCQRCGART